MPTGKPINGYPKNRKSRTMTPELRAAISAGNRRAWQRLEHQTRQHIGHLGVRPGGVLAEGGYVSAQGYRTFTGRWDHPLASKNGDVGEHRMVLYDKIGPGPHPCYWGCGKLLEWGGLEGIIADHVDHDKSNNDPANLVPSCNPCNWRRPKDGA